MCFKTQVSTKAQSRCSDGQTVPGGHNEEVQGNRIFIEASRGNIANKSTDVEGSSTVCTCKKSPIAKSNMGGRKFTAQHQQKPTQVTTKYEHGKTPIAPVLFFSAIFLCVFAWYKLQYITYIGLRARNQASVQSTAHQKLEARAFERITHGVQHERSF